MIVSMVLIGIVTVIGVVIIAVIETKRMEKGKPSILSRKARVSGIHRLTTVPILRKLSTMIRPRKD